MDTVREKEKTKLKIEPYVAKPKLPTFTINAGKMNPKDASTGESEELDFGAEGGHSDSEKKRCDN